MKASTIIDSAYDSNSDRSCLGTYELIKHCKLVGCVANSQR